MVPGLTAQVVGREDGLVEGYLGEKGQRELDSVDPCLWTEPLGHKDEAKVREEDEAAPGVGPRGQALQPQLHALPTQGDEFIQVGRGR